MENKFFKKYLKYKNKYLSIKQKFKQISGSNIDKYSEGRDPIESTSLLTEELSKSPNIEARKKIIRDFDSYEEYFKYARRLIYNISFFLFTNLQNIYQQGIPLDTGGLTKFYKCVETFSKEIIKEIITYGIKTKEELDVTLDLAPASYLTDPTFLNPLNIDKVKIFFKDCNIDINKYKKLNESDGFIKIGYRYKKFIEGEEIPINWLKNEMTFLSIIKRGYYESDIGIRNHLIDIIHL